jgi:hypothetical protein
MKKALISKGEIREQGYRVAQVENDENIFGVSDDLEWIDCPDDLIADQKWFDPLDNTFKDFPPELIVQASKDQPTTTGTQTI